MVDHGDIQAALSARIDGEDSHLDDDIVDAHLAECSECQKFWEQSLRMSRSLNVAGDMTPPEDLTELIYAGVEPEFQRVSARRVLLMSICRVVLVLLAVIYLVWAGRILGTDLESASVRVGIAASLLFVSWKPSQIPGVLLIIGAMFGFSIGFAVLEAITGGQAPWAQLLTLLFTCGVLVAMWVVGYGNPLKVLNAKPV
ncbi:zf-HC2 domain-containing protein [Corynebacterium appendicis]|uniref:zf-HC2 domain-containing protein n=1 Tax=Corynebacterium appendicis TaxID=163202 RepID=UPI00223B7B6C|nr:zf-HC2 domain-containing protein [Corynebacterium appendicis]MCT1684643.1 zf-HC2 domain-containing protein [Corynebacterium appendicis]